jgi:hypothetical protein
MAQREIAPAILFVPLFFLAMNTPNSYHKTYSAPSLRDGWGGF